MPLIPEDELCVQQMLGIDVIPEDIEIEYMIRVRMLHRQLAGGPIGPVAIVDMLRYLNIGPPPAQVVNEDGQADWRRVVVDTPVEAMVDEEWVAGLFAGEVGGGTIAVKINGKIDEFNSFQVRIPQETLPADVDADSFSVPAAVINDPDARADLLNDSESDEASSEEVETESEENDVETATPQGDIGIDDEVPRYVPVKVNWGQVKKGTEVWFRDEADFFDATFLRCVKPDKAIIEIDGNERQVDRAFLRLPD